MIAGFVQKLPRERLLRFAPAVIGSMIVVYALLPTVAPYVLLSCAFAPWFWLTRDGLPRPQLQGDLLLGAVVLFVGWAGLTLLWSPGGGDGFASWCRLAAYALLVMIARSELQTFPADARRANMTGFVAAFALMTAVTFADSFDNMPLRRALMSFGPAVKMEPFVVVENGWVTAVPPYVTNKSMAVLTSLFWPAILAMQPILKSGVHRLIGVALVALFLATVAISENDTAKLALVFSGLIFSLAYWARNAARWVVITGWLCCTLLVLPVALALSNANVQDQPWLPYSAQARVVIWGFTANEIMQRPLHGAGLASTRGEPDAERGIVSIGQPGRTMVAGTKIQPHNSFLQVWNELGGIGAALLSLTGLLLIQQLRCATSRTQPYYFAAFTALCVLAALQWSINSSWFPAIFGVSALFMRFAADACDLSARDLATVAAPELAAPAQA
jgi:O-Antigen ligase